MILKNLDAVISFSVVMLLLSLLITTLVQAVVACLNLRGANLVWGVSRLLEQTGPASLRRPTLRAFLRGKCARWLFPPKRVRRLLKTRWEPARRFFTGLFQETGAHQIAKAALKHPAVAQSFGRATSAVSQDELTKLLEDLGARPVRLSPGAGRKLQRYVTTRPLLDDVSKWFDSVMIRTTERFVGATRAITVVLALVGAIALHVDSLKIYHQLAGNEELRLKLVQNIDSWNSQAEKILNKTPVATAAVQAVGEELSGGDVPENVPGDLITREQGETWLRSNVAPAGIDKALDAYGRHYVAGNERILGEYAGHAGDIKTQLSELSLELVPTPLPGLGEYRDRTHLLGTLMTVLFLTLGAPFWYNLLRHAATLRPVVAQKRDPK